MADLASGIFGLLAGDPTTKQEHQLNSLSDFQTGTGEGLTTAGAKFDEDILSGDPTRTAQALAPEISSQQQQIEQNKLQGANFGTRSGGTAASNENADAAGRANIINLVGGLQQGTAGTALNAGSNLLGEASNNINSSANLATQWSNKQDALVGQTAKGAAEVAAAVAGGFTGGGGDIASAGGADPLGEMTGYTPSNFNMDTFQNPGPDLSVFQ